jgi:hypothetical protein
MPCEPLDIGSFDPYELSRCNIDQILWVQIVNQDRSSLDPSE